uniref:Signal transduction histidine kinase n=1 Tax=Candidatus Kentrum sp. TUN TaxID=2126343 RepID=A0A450ZQ01_9GAMM|nr:MAG: Signal transduction histidine kinase [Candidatus Kentron sp. TUN]VFK55857.1 MAG: Signal transduction histidine kinase [Candidatus Kentron sp. TUN]
MTTKQLLVIDDSPVFRESIGLAGKKHGWRVHANDNPDEVSAWLDRHKPDVVLLDWELGNQQPEVFAQLLQERDLIGNTLLLSAHVDDARRRFVEEYGLVGIRLKPLDLRRFEEEIGLPIPDEISLSVEELISGMRLAVDILNPDLTHILWSNDYAQKELLTHEQRLIMKWLRVEMEAGERDNVRRIDWDGTKGRFFESTLYRLDNGAYGLVRDWRDEGKRPHDHEFLNLEEENPTLEGWLRAVARLLAQRYAISRFRVYKISSLPHTQGLEKPHPSLVVPKFQSGAGIDPNAKSWPQVGFQPQCIPHIEEALKPEYRPKPKFVTDAEDSDSNCDIPRIRYGKPGTYRVLFPVRHPDTQETVALLAMDRRLDHIGELEEFDRKIVDLATRMASDEAGMLSEGQWELMKGLIEDVGRRIATWLEEDEKARMAAWHEAISRILIDTFADTQSSPEMIYDGISQICAALATKWNWEGELGEGRISGHIRGSTPLSERDKKGPQVSSWCIVLISDGQTHVSNSPYWRVVAGWGNAYGECRANGGRMDIPHAISTQGGPWKAVVIQNFQVWSEKAEDIHCECLSEKTREHIGSWLAVPMQVQGRIQALMVVHSPHAHYFTRFHSQLMERAAKRLLPLLAAALRETRARDAFTAAVMHEIKNESHGARLLVDRIQRKAEDTEWTRDLIKVRHYLDELNALGQDTLDIFRVGHGDRVRASKGKDEGTTTLGKLIDNATLGWVTLYRDMEFDPRLPEELAAREMTIPHVQDFRRVLRVLLHNAFRHGRDWVRIAAQSKDGADGGTQIQLTVINRSYKDTVLPLDQALNSAIDRPSDSPQVGGRLGLVVAKQLATEAGGSLGTLQYTGEGNKLGETKISMSWPVTFVV